MTKRLGVCQLLSGKEKAHTRRLLKIPPHIPGRRNLKQIMRISAINYALIKIFNTSSSVRVAMKQPYDERDGNVIFYANVVLSKGKYEVQDAT